MTIKPQRRPDVVDGVTHKVPTGCGSLYVTLNEIDERLFEVFGSLGKSGGCKSAMMETIARLISLALRAGVEPEDIIKHMIAVRCPYPIGLKGTEEEILSCSDAIAKTMVSHLQSKDQQASQPE
jgi:ribonucleoside-diphosphate reductase alpha chain